MEIAVEMSLYPLRADYIPTIQSFIDALNQHAGVRIETNAMSTQIVGEFDAVTRAVNESLRAFYQANDGKGVLVAKFLGPMD